MSEKRIAGVPDLGDDDPHPDDYQPAAVRADVEAMKDLLLWMRKEGMSGQVVTIGAVQITNVVDHFPRESVAKALAKLRDPNFGGAGEHDEMLEQFAEPSEREIMRRQ